MLAFLFLTPHLALAQEEAAYTKQLSPYVKNEGSDIDHIDMTNGSLTLDIPLLSYPQRGQELTMDFNIRYKAPQWYMSSAGVNYSNNHPGAMDVCDGVALFASTWSFDNPNSPSVLPDGVSIVHTQFLQTGFDKAGLETYYDSGAENGVIGSFTSIDGWEADDQGSTVNGNAIGGSTPGLYNPGAGTVFCSHTPANVVDVIYWIGDSSGAKHYYAAEPDTPIYRFSLPETEDGSGIATTAPWPGLDNVNFIDRKGVHYNLPGGNAISSGVLTTTSTDRFGNTIVNGKNSKGQSGWTDTVGRFIPNQSPGTEVQPGVPTQDLSKCGPGTKSANQWAVPASASAGGTETYYLCYSSVPYQTSFDIAGKYDIPNLYEYGANESSGTELLLSEIVLPNSTHYLFSYDAYLSLSQITLPTGGTISYTYANIGLYEETNSDTNVMFPAISRVVTSRTVNANDGTGAHTWTYAWQITPNPPVKTGFFSGESAVIDPQSNVIIHWVYPQGGRDMEQQYYQGYTLDSTGFPIGKTLLKTVDVGYVQSESGIFLDPLGSNTLPHAVPGSIVETWADGKARAHTLTYVPGSGSSTYYQYHGLLGSAKFGRHDTSLNPLTCACFLTDQLQSESFYDYGTSGTQGSLLQTKNYKYMWQDPTQGSKYQSANLLDLPESVTITNGNGAVIAATGYAYDETSVASSGLGAANNLNAAPGTVIGQNTSICKYLSPQSGTSCSQTANADYTLQTFQYYDSGELFQSTDALSHVTQRYYSECQGSVLTKTTNALEQSMTADYDCNTNKPTSSVDANQKTTSYKYNDALARLTETDYPDGGSVQVNYNQDPVPPVVTITTATGEPSGSIIQKILYDGLGRTTQVQLNSDPDGTDYIDTTYDNLGRVSTSSNPYRTPKDSTYGLATYAYDALSRKISQTNPDKTALSWSYNDNVTTSIDEVGNSWQRTEDGLGRLTNVAEPGGLQTGYTYDALGNLLTVNQHGTSAEAPRTRSFNYDSLSRLHCASNPENSQNPCPASATGTLPSSITSYIYDANSNVTSKTDARGITTSYHYDALNRLIQKSYNDGVTNTNLYGYDSSSVSFVPVPQNGRGNVQVSLANTIGRLTYASSANSGTLEAFSYDAMGRLVNQWSSTPSFNNNNGTVAAISAGYDLAGNQTSLTYPDGRKVSQIIDGAGRVSSVNYAAWNGTTHTSSYLSAVGGSNGYDAAGHLLGATFGNGVQVTSDYDNRERLHDLSYAGLGNVTLWGRQYVWTPNSNQQSTTDWITKTQRVFTYDNLNRLTSAQDFLNTVTGDGTASAGPGAAECTSTSGGASSSGASPQWTDPDDSNVLLSPGEPVNGAGWGFSQVSVQPNSLLAPDGSMTAHTVSATPNADSYIFDTASSDTEFSGLPMTGSVWLKSLTGSNQNIALSINANNAQGFQTVASKTVQLTTSWQQFQLSGMTPSTINSLNLVIGGGGSFTSGAVGLWQPRLENTGVANSTITNYQAYSQRFQQWTLVTGSNAPGSGVVDNAAIAPDGTQTAATVTPPTTCSGISSPCAPDFNMWLQVSNPAAFSNAAVTGSIWMRVASGTANVSLGLVETGSSSGPLVTHTFMLTTDWQRFQVSGTTQQTLSFLEFQIGGGFTLKSGQSIQVWGAQLELASVAGPYVPTGALPASEGTGITNILPYSQTFTNWAQHDASITGTVGAPDGSNTAAQVTAASTPSAGESGIDGYISEDVQNPTLYDAATITGSVFLRVPSGSGTIGVSFGTYTAASGFQYFMTQNFQLDTTWRRFTITGKVPNGLQRLFLVVGGSGSFANGQVVDIWGGQLELASTAGPYVATNGLPILAGSEIMNILPSSQQISGPGWAAGAGSEFLNQAIAPDGSNTAAVFSAWTTSSDSVILDYVSNPSYYDGQTMTASVYLRVASGTLPLNLYLASVGDPGGLVTAGQQQVTVSTSWQRFEVTGTVQNGLSQLFFQIGGGGTLNNGESIQIWGAQMNPGSSAAASQVTSCTTPNPYSGGSGTLLPNGLNEAYSYDSFGNILQKGSFTASYTANNQLTNGLYDAAGNLLSNYLSPMTWDAENRLISVGGATYFYDANGNRVEKQSVGVTDTVYFGGRPVARLSSGQWTDLIYGPNGMLAEVGGSEAADPSYRLLDNLGTEVGTVDSTGIMTNPLDYTPFGQVLSGSTNDPYLFTGQERDLESGLDYLSARYYGSNMGRMMSPDIVGGDLSNPQSLNRYAYVLNNPLSLTDPSGFAPQQVCGTASSDTPGYQGSVTTCSGGASDDGPVTVDGNISLDGAGQTFGGQDCGLCDGQPDGSGSSAMGMAQTGLDLAGMVPGPVGMVANIASAGISAYDGNWGTAALSLAFAVPVIGQFGAEARGALEGVELGEGGYRSFNAFKAANGKAGAFADWHHIVGQTESNLARFGPGAIHNSENLVAVPRNIHWQINSIYESETFLGSGQNVREWLAPQSFEAQRDYGLQILQRFGIKP